MLGDENTYPGAFYRRVEKAGVFPESARRGAQVGVADPSTLSHGTTSLGDRASRLGRPGITSPGA